jgi:Arc/MetJ-type ribon-helix-helix transcriptional regulator
MLNYPYPPELGNFIEQQIALGYYQSEEDLVVDAIRIMPKVKDQQREFVEDVRQGMDQLDRDEFSSYDENGLKQRFEDLESRALHHSTSGDCTLI